MEHQEGNPPPDSPAPSSPNATPGGFYGASPVKDFDPWRPRWPNAWREQLNRQLIELLHQDNPRSIRHCFYRMTDPRLPVYVPKAKKGSDLVERQLKKLRRAGRVPYRYIVDTTRMGYHVETYGDAEEYLRDVAGLYRGHLWAESDVHVEVWCEAAGFAGVIAGTCRELAVSLYPCRGFPSITLGYEAAREINAGNASRAVVLYMGDYDPSGVLISDTVERELKRHLRVPLEMRRLAVNEEQVAEYNLPTKPRKKTEVRLPDMKYTVEVEAMPSEVLRPMVREAVEGYLPAGALQAAKEAERDERAVLMRLARMAGRIA